MLSRVQVEHELTERALHPREATLQHHEARAGQLRGSLEVHLLERLTQVEMFPRRKAIVLFAPKW